MLYEVCPICDGTAEMWNGDKCSICEPKRVVEIGINRRQLDRIKSENDNLRLYAWRATKLLDMVSGYITDPPDLMAVASVLSTAPDFAHAEEMPVSIRPSNNQRGEQ